MLNRWIFLKSLETAEQLVRWVTVGGCFLLARSNKLIFTHRCVYLREQKPKPIRIFQGKHCITLHKKITCDAVNDINLANPKKILHWLLHDDGIKFFIEFSLNCRGARENPSRDVAVWNKTRIECRTHTTATFSLRARSVAETRKRCLYKSNVMMTNSVLLLASIQTVKIFQKTKVVKQRKIFC